MKLGDRNNYYFFVFIKSRVIKNYIIYLVNDEGFRVYKIEEIKKVLYFYNNLIGVKVILILVIDLSILRVGLCLDLVY